MGQMGQNNTDVTYEQARPRWRIRRTLLGAGALAAVGALAACSGVATNETQAADALSKLGATADGGTVQGHSAPAMISRAIAHGKYTAHPAHKAGQGQPGHPRPSGSATATPTGTPGGTPTSTPSGTPSATPSGTVSATPTGSQSGSDPSGQNPATTLSGYTLEYTQEFTGDSLPSGWGEYAGVPGGETSSAIRPLFRGETVA